MRSVDYEIKFTGCVHSNQNQGVYLIKQRACWSAPYIVNKLNTAAKEVFNFTLPSLLLYSMWLVQRC